MNIKRLITGLIGFPLVACLLIFGNKYVIDVAFAITAGISIYEFNKALKLKSKPIQWLGYIPCVLIALIHVIPIQYLIIIAAAIVPVFILILFLNIIFTNMKYNIVDISATLFGILYITLFILFIPLLMATENGKYLVWYIILAAWGTDTFAYIFGCSFGKHKFTQISPKKSIEGCIGGTLGAIILIVVYTFFINKYVGLDINYFAIAGIALILSLLGQIGDLSASAVKRYVEIKDYGNIFPGHGGMLDRIDSILFIAPFAYFLLLLI